MGWATPVRRPQNLAWIGCRYCGELVGWAFGPGWLVGCGVGALALAGDVMSSAIKRRLNRPPGAEVPGLDQVPEGLLPLLLFREPLGISAATALMLTLVFTIVDLFFTPLRHRRRG